MASLQTIVYQARTVPLQAPINRTQPTYDLPLPKPRGVYCDSAGADALDRAKPADSMIKSYAKYTTARPTGITNECMYALERTKPGDWALPIPRPRVTNDDTTSSIYDKIALDETMMTTGEKIRRPFAPSGRMSSSLCDKVREQMKPNKTRYPLIHKIHHPLVPVIIGPIPRPVYRP